MADLYFRQLLANVAGGRQNQQLRKKGTVPVLGFQDLANNICKGGIMFRAPTLLNVVDPVEDASQVQLLPRFPAVEGIIVIGQQYLQRCIIEIQVQLDRGAEFPQQ